MKTLFLALTTVAVCLGAADLALAHGKRHAGGHAYAADAVDCLKPIRQKGMMGVGFWENSCSDGVHVKWRIESDERGTGCMSRPASHYPCLTYVGPNTRQTATMSDNGGGGSVNWMACRAEDFASDPWPVITDIKPDGSVKFNCFHMGFGSGDKVVSKSELETALRQNHGQMLISMNEYKEQEVARIEREEGKRKEREYYAELEQLRLEEELSRQRMQQAYNSSFLGQFNNLMNGIRGMAPTFPSGGGYSGVNPSASCDGMNAEMEQATAQLERRDGGMCQNARLAKRIFTRAVTYYQNNNCPTKLVRYSREMVQWANETERKTCSDIR